MFTYTTAPDPTATPAQVKAKLDLIMSVIKRIDAGEITSYTYEQWLDQESTAMERDSLTPEIESRPYVGTIFVPEQPSLPDLMSASPVVPAGDDRLSDLFTAADVEAAYLRGLEQGRAVAPGVTLVEVAIDAAYSRGVEKGRGEVSESLAKHAEYMRSFARDVQALIDSYKTA